MPVADSGLVALQDSALLLSGEDSLPVLFRGDTLFRLRYAPPPLTLRERRTRIQDALNTLYARLPEEDTTALDSFFIRTSGQILVIFYTDVPLVYLYEPDAAAAGIPLPQLGKQWVAAIRASLAQQREGFHHWAQVGIAAAIGLGLLLLFWLLNRVYPAFRIWFVKRIRPWLGPVRIQDHELVTVGSILKYITMALNGLRIVLYLVALYFYLPFVFSLFPHTKYLADKLVSWVLTPVHELADGIVDYLPNLFYLLVIWIFIRYLLKITRSIFLAIGRGSIKLPGFYTEWALPTYKLVRFIIWIFGLVIVFPYLPGSDSEAFRGISVLIGVMLSFGSGSAISNVVSGFILTYMRPFQMGDIIQVNGSLGEVIEKSLFVTRIRTFKNVEVTLPNSQVLGQNIENYTYQAKKDGLILHTSVTIGYDVPWYTVHRLLLKAAGAIPDVKNDPAPFVLQRALNDFYVEYEINIYINQPKKMLELYSALHASIQNSFFEEGVEIMSPHIYAHRDGTKAAIPPDFPLGIRKGRIMDTD